MKLLYITESVPNRDPALGDGSSMIPYELLRNLPAGIGITLLTFAGPVAVPPEVQDRCAAVHVLPTRGRLLGQVLSVPARPDAGTLERATVRAVRLARRLSAASDATLVHGPHALFVSSWLHGPQVLQTVDPWSLRMGMERSLGTGWRRTYRAWKARRLLAAERRLPDRARLLTVGSRDAAAWSALLGRPVRSVGNGTEPAPRAGRAAAGPVVCFVGSLNYGPNVDSARVLINEVAPAVWRLVPDATFVLAGRRPGQDVLSLSGDRVRVLANVPEVGEVFASSRVAAFADEYGVGIRNSVREALAAGLPVVATSVAAREQEAHPLLTVEDDKALFARKIVESLNTPTLPPAHPAARTWADAARDYLDEVKAAIEQDRNRPTSGGAGP